jgi:hypothetical protein
MQTYCQNTGAYPANRLNEVILALSEAFGWLQAQRLIVDAPDGYNAANGSSSEFWSHVESLIGL